MVANVYKLYAEYIYLAHYIWKKVIYSKYKTHSLLLKKKINNVFVIRFIKFCD